MTGEEALRAVCDAVHPGMEHARFGFPTICARVAALLAGADPRQRTLFDPPAIADPPTLHPRRGSSDPERDLRAKTARWIEANPELFAAIEASALRLAAGRKYLSMQKVIEDARMFYAGDWHGEFKIANECVAYLARRIMQDHPDAGLDQIIRCRPTRC